MDDLKLALDIIIVLLLVPTLVYAVILNNRLTRLRRARDELSSLIQSFNEATIRAESGVPRLRKAAEQAALSLQEKVEKAQSLRDDLAFMVERADSMADRLEGSVRTARGDAFTPSRPEPGRGVEAPRAEGPRPGVPRPGLPETGVDARPGVVRQRLAGDRGRPAMMGEEGLEGIEAERSEAERELLKALRALR